MLFLFFFSEEEFFHRGKTDRRINTEHMGREMLLKPESLAFYLQRHDCMHYICSDHLF